MENENIKTLSINTIRILAMDAVQKAGSGHPGTAMALAPAAYVDSIEIRYLNKMRHYGKV